MKNITLYWICFRSDPTAQMFLEYLLILRLSSYPETETIFSSFLLSKYPSNVLSAEINLFFQTKTSYCSISSFIPNLYKFNLLFFSLIIPLRSSIFVLVILCPPLPPPSFYKWMSVLQYLAKFTFLCVDFTAIQR